MRLTQGIKEQMVTKITNAKFSEKEKHIEIQMLKLGADIYNSIDRITEIKKLPSNWFKKTTRIHCSFGGCRDYIKISNDVYEPVPEHIAANRLDFDSTHDFTKRFKTIQDAKYALIENKKELIFELRVILNGVNTDKQLIAIWPEAIEWLPKTSTTYLPAIQSVDKLKQLLSADM